MKKELIEEIAWTVVSKYKYEQLLSSALIGDLINDAEKLCPGINASHSAKLTEEIERVRAEFVAAGKNAIQKLHGRKPIY